MVPILPRLMNSSLSSKKASIYGRLEVEAMLLEREVAWKREDVEKWTTIRDAEKFLAQRNLEPMVQERDALREELDQVRENIRILNDEEEDESDGELASV